MTTIIGPNKSMLYGGVIFQILVVAAVSYFSFDLISHITAPFDRKKGADCAGLVVSIILSIRYVRTFYSMPYWVTIDDVLKTLDIKYFFRSPMMVRCEDMLSFKDTTIKVSTRSGTLTYSGFYLHLADGSRVLFSERNFEVENYVYIESMLAYWGIKKMEGE
jgi:hypothetical protein